MAEEYPSSNPFRRKTPSTTPSLPPETPTPSIINHSAYQPSQPLADSTNLQEIDVSKKSTKKVRVQSPPPPSPSTPSIPDSSSTIGEDAYTKSPITVAQDDDPFDSTNSTSSEEEDEIRPSQAPLNPFSKTLATMERSEKEASVSSSTNITSSGRASMDVEAFKRLLMTGNSGLGMSTPPTASPAHPHHGLGDGGSSTDTSSISRQSIFEPVHEPVQEPHQETPRTSHELSEPEDDHHGISAEFPSATSARKKPPPPSSRHGKLIKVELRDEPSTSSSSLALASPQPPTPISITSQKIFSSSPPNRSNTDLNKPLPLAPKRTSHESDRESIFDKESAGKIPEPPSPSASIRKKLPPAPPLTRRHSQLVSDSKIIRETGRLSPKAEEEGNTTVVLAQHGRPRSDSAKAPPPPPTRRPLSVRHASHPGGGSLTSPSSVSLPALPPPTPPARGSSKSISGRPPSVVSMDMSSSKRISMAPPPPPPRHGRSSMDDGSSRRTSGDLGRRSSESARILGGLEDDAALQSSTTGGTDILAEMTKLQKEIDALRTQSERSGAN